MYRIIILLLMLSILLAKAGAVVAQPTTPLNQVDAQGRKQGQWQKVYPNGQVAYKAQFADDMPLGLLVRYHENGKTMAIIDYFDGKGESLAQFFDKQGSKVAEGTYQGRNKVGLWHYYDKAVLVMTQEYKQGLLDGVQLVYFPDGQIYERQRFVQGQQDGLYEQFDQRGQLLIEALYRQGEQEGPVRYYYDNNQTRIEGQYAHNKRTGVWTFYDPKGRVERQTTFVDGVAADQASIDSAYTQYMDKLKVSGRRIPDPQQHWQ